MHKLQLPIYCTYIYTYILYSQGADIACSLFHSCSPLLRPFLHVRACVQRVERMNSSTYLLEVQTAMPRASLVRWTVLQLQDVLGCAGVSMGQAGSVKHWGCWTPLSHAQVRKLSMWCLASIKPVRLWTKLYLDMEGQTNPSYLDNSTKHRTQSSL